jgi:hypothetical protein
MSLKTLSASDKAAFAKAGLHLTPSMEHIAAEAKAALSIDWPTVLQTGLQIVIAILASFGITLNPAPTMKTCAPGCCDHCCCCCKCIKLTLELLQQELEHHCQSCDDCGYFG